MSQKTLDLARELERIVAANRYFFTKQPSHTGIPRLVTLVEDIVRALDIEDRKTFHRSDD